MATRDKAVKYRQNSINSTFEASSLDSTAVEKKLFGQAEQDVDFDDGPVVFICGKCKLPVGDSMSWDGSDDSQNQIRLKRKSGFWVATFLSFLAQLGTCGREGNVEKDVTTLLTF